MNNAAIKAVREIATGAVGYTHVLKFTRRFTQGTLAGLTHDDAIGFCSAADCDEWVSSINRQNRQGACDYRVDSYSIVKVSQ